MLGGDDVPSAVLARDHDWSPATIRAELAALERAGLVDRAHRSAGCRPTRAGLELYVASRPRDAEPPIGAARAVERSLAASGSLEQDQRAAARVLAEVGGCVAVSFVADAGRRPVVELELVPLSATRLLVVVGFVGGATTMHPVSFDECPSVEQLTADALGMQARLREFCLGRTLVEAHADLLRVRDDLRLRVDRRLAEVVRLGLSLCAGAELDPLWLSVAGQARLARGLGATGGELLAQLEDDRRLAEILCRLLPLASASDPMRATVVLGGAALLDRHPAGSEAASEYDSKGAEAGLRLALVGCRLPATTAARTGAIAILGPDRMDYASVIPLVEYAARALAART